VARRSGKYDGVSACMPMVMGTAAAGGHSYATAALKAGINPQDRQPQVRSRLGGVHSQRPRAHSPGFAPEAADEIAALVMGTAEGYASRTNVLVGRLSDAAGRLWRCVPEEFRQVARVVDEHRGFGRWW